MAIIRSILSFELKSTSSRNDVWFLALIMRNQLLKTWPMRNATKIQALSVFVTIRFCDLLLDLGFSMWRSVKICLFLLPLCPALGGWVEHFNQNHGWSRVRFQACLLRTVLPIPDSKWAWQCLSVSVTYWFLWLFGPFPLVVTTSDKVCR